MFAAREGQKEILEATEPVLVVLGGAGTGKTTTAAAVVRQALDQAARTQTARRHRALYLSFSRSAVSQIVDRSAGILGDQVKNVEVITFHGLAWRLIRRWGSAIGLADPSLLSPSEARLFGDETGLVFSDLIPAALRLLRVPAIKAHLQARWTIVVVDEFQDTDNDQFDFVLQIRGVARLLFLGDLNQCIYASLPRVVGVGQERVDAALELPGARRLDLPDVSHRDPTQVLGAAAVAIRRRDFAQASVRAALDKQMLVVRHTTDRAAEGPSVAACIEELLDSGHQSVSVFSHHVDSTASLSDHLTSAGIAHEIVGLPDAITSSVQAQFEMLKLASAQGGMGLVRRALGVFVTSVERGSEAPRLAQQIVGRVEPPATLARRLAEVEVALVASRSMPGLLQVVADVPDSIGLLRGGRTWSQGHRLFMSLLGPRLCRSGNLPSQGFEVLQAKLANGKAAQLTQSDSVDPADVQLMGLYQSKGREADATIVVLREGDYYGREREPMQMGSRLLYVVLTRARQKTFVLTFGSVLPPLISPFLALSDFPN